MKILSIDPGPADTSWMIYEDGKVLEQGFEDNDFFLSWLRWDERQQADLAAIEMVACYGMPVGAEIFETCTMIGRMEEILRGGRVERVFRKDIKLHLCGSLRAKDANVRQALIGRLGPPGTKKAPGPTHGIYGHAWAALAVAVYAQDVLS